MSGPEVLPLKGTMTFSNKFVCLFYVLNCITAVEIKLFYKFESPA